MTYTIDFAPHRFDGTTYEGIDPYSREPAEQLANGSLSPEEVEAVHAVLRRAAGRGPEAQGKYELSLGEGVSVRFFAGSLPNTCVMAIDGYKAPMALATLIFDVMVAGRWVIRHLARNGESIAHSMDSVRGVRGPFGPTIVVESPEDMQFILAHGVKAWQEEQRNMGGLPRWK